MSYRPDTSRPKPCPRMNADGTCDACRGSRGCICPTEFEMVRIDAPPTSKTTTASASVDTLLEAHAAAAVAAHEHGETAGYYHDLRAAEKAIRDVCQAPAPSRDADTELIAAVRKLVKAKGRFHTEQNYKALTDALSNYDAAHPTNPKE